MKARLGGLLAGSIAGLLTVGLAELTNKWHAPPRAGVLFAFAMSFGLATPFGVVVSIYLCFLFRGSISAVKVIAFLISCGIANTLAWSAGVGLGGNVHPGNRLLAAFSMFSRESDMAIASLSGGMVGAIVVAAAAILLFFGEKTFWTIVAMAFVSSVVGGLLGVLGWEFGSHLERHTPSANAFVSLFLVWQAGMGLLLGFLLAHAQPSRAIQPTPIK